MLNIAIGSPTSSYVIVEPGVASKLVGKRFAQGEKAEVPLTFFHKTKHFAKGKFIGPCTRLLVPPLISIQSIDDDDACPKLYIDQDLASKVSNGISSPAILFRYGVNSTLAIKGSKDGTFLSVRRYRYSMTPVNSSVSETEARVFAGALDGIERSFNRLKDA